MSRTTGENPADGDVPEPLARLAAAHGVATSYLDQRKRSVPIAAETVAAVLAALGVDATTPAAIEAALADTHTVAAVLPPTVVRRAGRACRVDVAGKVTAATLTLEDGRPGPRLAPENGLDLPELPIGYHRLHVQTDEGTGAATVISAPAALPEPPRTWGWMVQLYAVGSSRSWGMGDLGDLAALARWSGSQGADLIVCNPLHGVAPLTPLEPSPYYPASRRFTNPVYLRVEDLPEYAEAPARVRAQVDALRLPPPGGLIDRDAVWRAKSAAFALLFPGAVEADDVDRVDGVDEALTQWATWCALTEVHGRDWRAWPEELRRPESAAVRAAALELADRVAFHAWLQRRCAQQLAAAQRAATDAGMAIGIVHDLAVGTDPGGADAWALQDVLAGTTTVGAPPDEFNQRGQNWQLPPWRPDRLAADGYTAYRDLVRRLLAHAGGIRIDHILGVFRLWWIPAGAASAAAGSYVRYAAEAMLAVLAVEATRAGAVVVGEDLGTVEPAVATTLASWGVLGSSVLWFERPDEPGAALLPLAQWRRQALASISTHDLPTAAGFLAGEHVRVRAELGQLGRSLAEEQAQADDDRAELLALLRAEGLLERDADETATVIAMHEALARVPSVLAVAQLADAVGDLRQPNLPGTTDEYPNWRLPLTDRDGRVVLLDELPDRADVARVVGALRRR